MKTYRDVMAETDENSQFCAPYSFLSGKVTMAIMIDGKEFMPTPETIKTTAKLVNPDYDKYKGWSDTRIILDADCKKIPCKTCPWFDICDAMDADAEDEA